MKRKEKESNVKNKKMERNREVKNEIKGSCRNNNNKKNMGHKVGKEEAEKDFIRQSVNC